MRAIRAGLDFFFGLASSSPLRLRRVRSARRRYLARPWNLLPFPNLLPWKGSSNFRRRSCLYPVGRRFPGRWVFLSSVGSLLLSLGFRSSRVYGSRPANRREESSSVSLLLDPPSPKSWFRGEAPSTGFGGFFLFFFCEPGTRADVAGWAVERPTLDKRISALPLHLPGNGRRLLLTTGNAVQPLTYIEGLGAVEGAVCIRRLQSWRPRPAHPENVSVVFPRRASFISTRDVQSRVSSVASLSAISRYARTPAAEIANPRALSVTCYGRRLRPCIVQTVLPPRQK